LQAKRLTLLRDAVPKATVFALLVNPKNSTAIRDASDAQTAAATLGLRLRVLEADSDRNLETTFAAMTEQRVGALSVNIDPFFLSRREQIIALAVRYAVPAIYDRREWTASSGLMSYGADRLNAIFHAGTYVGRILKGDRPVDLPVQQATKFEFVINLKTAKALGLELSPTLVTTADEVIE
jgi:putative tryptophan/tyrosine transport system substrate-binding protein